MAKSKKQLMVIILLILLIIGVVIAFNSRHKDEALPMITEYSSDIDEETSAHTKPVNDLPPPPEKEENEFQRVILNTTDMRFHKKGCSHIEECSFCTTMTRKEAIRRGGIPCGDCL